MPQYPHLEAKTVLLLGTYETLAGSADAGCLVVLMCYVTSLQCRACSWQLLPSTFNHR